MKNKKTIILVVFILLSSIAGYKIGLSNQNSPTFQRSNTEKKVINILKERINVKQQDSSKIELTNLQLICQNNIRFLYSFDYVDTRTKKTSSLAAEMIIDEENDYYFIGNISKYQNAYNDNCINISALE